MLKFGPQCDIIKKVIGPLRFMIRFLRDVNVFLEGQVQSHRTGSLASLASSDALNGHRAFPGGQPLNLESPVRQTHELNELHSFVNYSVSGNLLEQQNVDSDTIRVSPALCTKT